MPKTKSAKKKYRLLLCLTNLTIQYWISVHSRIFYLWWREMERQAWSMEVPVNLALMIRWGLNNFNVTSLVDRWHEMKEKNNKDGTGHSISYICFLHWLICYGKRRKSSTSPTILTWSCTKTSAHLLSSILLNWHNMLLRTKKKISQRIQSGRSYDLTFPSCYAMRKLGLFKWFVIASGVYIQRGTTW